MGFVPAWLMSTHTHIWWYPYPSMWVCVTGEGQKTSSMLTWALSQLEMRFRQRQVPLVWPKLEWRTQVLLSVETEETQLGSLGDQVSSYLYYSGYTEPSTTKATQNTPVVWIWVTTSKYKSCRVTRIWVSPSQCPTSHYESYTNAEMSIHISQTINQPVPLVRQCLHTWSQSDRYNVRPALPLLPYLAPGAKPRMRLLVAQAVPGRCQCGFCVGVGAGQCQVTHGWPMTCTSSRFKEFLFSLNQVQLGPDWSKLE